MRIVFLRTGGFAGLRLALELDTNAMDPQDASEMRDLVQESGFYEMEDRLSSSTEARDRFQYRVRVTTSTGQYHEIVADEDSVPGELQPLLARLTALALKRSPE